MDSTDDDFGELYVDVKVQASDTFDGHVGFVKSCEESECATDSGKDRGFEGTVKPDSEAEMNNLGAVAKDSSLCVDACVANLTAANEEDSEFSDSDDDLNIVLKDDDSTLARVSNTNNGAVETSKTCSFQRRRTRNWCTMPNAGMVNGRMTMDTSAYNAFIDPSLRISHYGCTFSHTWSRTTFDVNFDVFEKKPWMNPGTDISDFFNFGFNEQSWKDYYKPLGRAIEVGGGTRERIPSADLRGPRNSDPDVVIQIPVTNDVEELSTMAPVKARSLSITSNEASRSEDSHSNKIYGLNSVDDSTKNEAFLGCQDENIKNFSGEQPPPTENCCGREVTPCDKEMIEEEKEEDFGNSDEADPSSVERESSLGDRIRLSPTSSCSVGKNEESDDYEIESLKDSATDGQREVNTPPRRAGLAEHEAVSIERGERSGTTHSRHRRSHEDSGIRHCGRAGYVVHGSMKHRIVTDASPTPDRVRGKKVSSRFGSFYRDSNKNWQHGPLFTLEGDETEGKDVHYSNRERCHGRLYSSVDHARQRDHRFDGRNNKESSLGRGFDHSNSYKFEERCKEYTSLSSFNPSQRNSRSSFKEEDDRYGWHHFERKYGHERSPTRAYENSKERNGYDWLREPYYEDCKPITDMDYRYRSEYSSAHEIHNLKQSPENDLSCRRRGNYDYNLHRHRSEDGCHRPESRIQYELDYREIHAFAEVGWREHQGYKRHEEFSERYKRHHYTHDWHLDRFVSKKDGCKYRIQDAWPSPSLSLRESWYTKEAKGDIWRYDTRDFRTAKAYDSQNNHLYEAALRDGRTQNLGRSGSIRSRLNYDDDDWVRPDRGIYKLGDDIQCSRRKVAHSENPSSTDKLLVRDIKMPIHNRMSTKQRSRYFKSHIHEPDADELHHKSKKLRGDGNAFIRCQDPVDLIGRQGKLSNQSEKGFSNGEDTKEQQDRQKPRKLMWRREEKGMEIQDINDKEEGEIIEKAWNVKGVEIDNERIQESLKKMEKRRERFKETKSPRTGKATFESQTERRAKTDVTNQQRPVRKRRWCAAS